MCSIEIPLDKAGFRGKGGIYLYGRKGAKDWGTVKKGRHGYMYMYMYMYMHSTVSHPMSTC